MELLTNEEIMDYSYILQYSVKYLEAYLKCFSTNIVINENNNKDKNNHFHTHLIVRVNDNLEDKIYSLLENYKLDKEPNEDEILKTNYEIQEIQNFIVRSNMSESFGNSNNL